MSFTVKSRDCAAFRQSASRLSSRSQARAGLGSMADWRVPHTEGLKVGTRGEERGLAPETGTQTHLGIQQETERAAWLISGR